MDTPTFTLQDGTEIPLIGLGTWKLTEDEGKKAIKQALNLGYRHIDTAYYYQNHQAVGQAISEASVDRSDMFVTTKIWRDHLTENKLQAQFKESLNQLDLEYVDLLLVHWPNQSVPIQETLTAMQQLQEQNKVQAIGVSNFTRELLDEALSTGIEPVVNQVEYHPTFVQQDLKDYCDEHDITLTAYSPLGHTGQDLQLDPVQSIAEKKSVAPAAVIIAWLIAQGIVAIPKAAGREHQQQNLAALDIDLSEKEIKRINKCNTGNRLIAPGFSPFADN